MSALKLRIVGGVSVLALMLVAPAPAFAQDAPPSPSRDVSAAPKASRTYSDAEVVAMLVFASGPAATEHPDLAAKIRGSRSRSTATMAQISAFTRQLMAFDPQFHELITMGVQANDPYAAQTAMERLNTDVQQWIQRQRVKMASPATADRADGWLWHDSYVLTEQNAVAVWQVAAAHTVAAAQTAAVVLVIFPEAVSYQFEVGKPNTLQRQEIVARVTAGLKRR